MNLPGAFLTIALAATITAAGAVAFRCPPWVWSLATGTAVTALLTGVLLNAVIPAPEPFTAIYTITEAAL